MLAKLQYIIEHSIKDNKEKYDSLLSGLENVLSVVNNNRNELSGIEEGETEETVKTIRKIWIPQIQTIMNNN